MSESDHGRRHERLAQASVDVEGRPTGYAGGANAQRWKTAVRAALAGVDLPPRSRVAVEVDFRLGADQRGHSAPDLDNLIKSTVDALDEALGNRPGKFAEPRADDERVDRIVASKRPLRQGESPGARTVLTELVDEV